MIRRLLTCLGIAFLLLAHPFVDLYSSQAMIRYHSAVPLSPLIGALLIDLAALTLLWLAALAWLCRTRAWPWIRIALAVWLPLVLLRRVLMLSGHEMQSRVVQALIVLGIVGASIVHRKKPLMLAHVIRAGTLGLACFGLSFMFLLPRLARLWLWRPAVPLVTYSPLPAARPDHPRIVWIVLDELSYQQAFGQREAGLALPSLDSLRSQSILYSDAQPVGDKTDRVLPSLISGQPIQDITYTWSNRLLYQQPVTEQWRPFQADATLFALAHRHGWRTGVTGWYNPYCSLLAPWLDRCFWSNRDMDKAAWVLPPGTSAISGAILGFRALVGSRVAKEALLTETARSRLHLASEEVIYQRSLQMAGNDQLDFMLLHLPVPHFPNVYDRRTGQFSFAHHYSYADNLALADRDLGGILQVLEKSSRWADTTVVVCGDHSWRTTWWRPTLYWTAEDERISHGGQFDPRPVLLIHFAGQTQPFINPEAVSLMEAHRVIGSLIANGSVQLDDPGAGLTYDLPGASAHTR